MRISLVTNFCPFYRVGIFRLLQKKLHVEILLFGIGKEPVWEKKNPIYFDSNFIILRSHLFLENAHNLFLYYKKTKPQIIIKSIDGKIELLISFLYAKIYKTPFLLWTELWYVPSGLSGSIKRIFLQLIYKKVNALIVPGYNVKLHLMDFNIPPEKIFTAKNATDNMFYSKHISDDEILAIKKQLFLNNYPIILFVGRLEKQKGLCDLMNVIPNNPQLNFLIIGDGQLKTVINTSCSKNTNVKHLDYKKKEDLIKYYALCDALILPSITLSKYREVWGFVINEAMLQKKAIIATTSVGAAVGGLVKDGKNGYLYKEGDLYHLDSILKKLTFSSLKAMGQESWKIISDWDFNAMFKGFSSAIKYTGFKCS